MQDVLPDDRRYWDVITATAEDLARRYGFQRVDLPIIEATELFARGVGEGSDFFVQKEMYTLTEPDGSSITLRPEFTAGFMRAYIQNGMASWTQPVKLYTIGPSFRRERPQAGRLRQHSQFNCEILGEEDPAADVEVMMLAMSLYRTLGFKGLTFQLNSTGCPVCKPAYIEKLVAYLDSHLDRLADIDKERLRKNPLRVLDSKEPGMDALLAGAPHIIDHLCDDCREHFADVRGLLDELDQSYTINFRLVRGIDRPDEGQVTVMDVPLSELDDQARTLFRRRHIGFVFQFFNLIPTLTVEENLLLPLELNGQSDRERAYGLLEAVGLKDRARSYPDRLSGGEQQRVALARALAHDPELVLADEPTGNLDAENGARVLELLGSLLRERGKTLLVATHSQELVGLADRVVDLTDGRLVERA